jgi:glycyl-tRNA synthetase
METIVSLAKRRGFVFQASEIYGGQGGSWDYGPLGVELKRNLKDAWWRSMVYERDDIVGLDSAILQNPQVWDASGHLSTFTDPMVDCRNCKKRFRADDLSGDACPSCGMRGALTEARQFNLMFKTFVGPVEEEATSVFLRPETAQGIFVNFSNVQTSMRRKLPFGIAQIGKSFRNEITPGNFVFRSREFEQMEMEYFCRPEDADRAFEEWIERRFNWYVALGMDPAHLRIRVHAQEELSHYSRATSDIEYLFPMGWSELEGIANRGDFDLRQHAKSSGKDLEFFDDETKEHIVPFVVEPAAGVDRSFLAFLLEAYREETVREETRTVLKFHPSLAPVKVAVLPLSRNERLVPLGREVFDLVRGNYLAQYDDSQSIGRRYRRQDETGTPLCVTVDFDSLEDRAVTIRERDSMEQVRVPIANLRSVLGEKLGSPLTPGPFPPQGGQGGEAVTRHG